MGTHEKDNFLQIYDWASDWQQLPWAHDEPTLYLAEICNLREPGTALDIGCGSGMDSVYLAKRGWDVTSLDFVPQALAFTQQRAEKAGVSVTPVETDITEWDVPQQFDLVLDHGLLHNMDAVRFAAYRERIVQAVAPDGDFVMLHWHPLYPGQPQGETGPTRTPREDVEAFFTPEFQVRYFAREDYADMNDSVGGGFTNAYYWFRPNPIHLRPVELIEQVKATLTRHDVDFEAIIADAGDGLVGADLPPKLMARIVGPGRLSITPETPQPDEAATILRDWAEQTGQDPNYVENLLYIFADAKLANLCTPNPRCDVCEVQFCRRLRHR